MMTCEGVREQLLEASTTALAGRGESAVARHVRSCAACQAVAQRILDDTAQLQAGLDRLQPRMSKEEAVRLALEGRRASVGGPTAARGAGSRRVPRRWRQWAAIPVAAAAAITALVLTVGPRDQRLEDAGPRAPAVPGATTAAVSLDELSVDIPEDGRVAVFETTNPTITVVWFY